MYKPGEVFQPKAFPKMTYIDRLFDEDSTYEEELQDDLEDTGTLVVITGASKSGHIVLSAVGERVAAVNFVDEDNVRGVGQHYSVRRGNMRIFFMGLADFINGGETN